MEDNGVGIPQNKLSRNILSVSRKEECAECILPKVPASDWPCRKVISLHHGLVKAEVKLNKGCVYSRTFA